MMEIKIFLTGTFLFMGILAICHFVLCANNNGAVQSRASIRILRSNSAIQERPLKVNRTSHDAETFISAFAPHAAEISLRGEPHQSVQIVFPQKETGTYIELGESALKMSEIHSFPAYMSSINADGKLTLKLGARITAAEKAPQETDESPSQGLSVIVSY